MKTLTKFGPFLPALAFAVALIVAPMSNATPYASGITNIAGKINFILNEGGGTVNVVFEDHTTNAMGVLPAGTTNFTLGAHTSYQIICTKIGNGTPVQISSDSGTFSGWNSPRGVDVNKNPTNGFLFGRTYIGNSAVSSTRQHGLYALNADLSDSPLGRGTNAAAISVFASSGASGPYRITVAPDNSIFVTDFSTAAGTVWQFGPNFEFTNLVLNPVGENQGIAAGTHGDPTGVFVKGSLATSNLTVYTSDPGLAAPATAQLGTGGEGPTSPGNYNNLFRYDIGAGNFVVTGATVHAGGGGTGYSVNDYLAISGGTGNTATAIVTSVSSGIITGLAITNGGLYTASPPTPNSPTGGTGTNALIDLAFSGPLPWRSAPNLATCLGLPGFFDSQNPEITVETNGNMVGAFRRLNFSDGNIQVFDPNGNIIYTSLKIDALGNASDAFFNSYGGVRISPDNRWLATLLIGDQILVANLLPDGTPDESSIFTITNTPNVANARGLAWDAADNLYACSSGQGLLRVYSLGLPTTAITSNDFTGTNGSFQLILPPVTATIAATTPQASQNYINNASNPGTPIPGVFTISLNQPTLATPVSVAYALGGSAAYSTNYTLGLGTNANGVIISSNFVTFPATNFPGVGNWSVDVTVIPTATPVIGPTLTVVPRLAGGSNYLAGSPVSAAVSIANTGPQLLLLTPATASTMTREVLNDNAQFIVTRLGDTNGPGNSSVSITPLSYTVTNFTYGGTAAFPGDYTAQAQNLVLGANPINGTPGIVIHPGDVTITAMVGNPVAHPNLAQAPATVTITVDLTNSVTGTNATSSEGYAYSVSNSMVTLTEFDNTKGPETVIWSNPLTNPLDSTNWTVTFASTNMGTLPVLPAVILNYTNGATEVSTGGPNGTNDFDIVFGNPISLDGVPQSQVMSANGWTTALRMTVNKHAASAAGVNAFPAGLVLNGNYALRFSMYLSLYQFAHHQPGIQPVTVPREFAAFGINTLGTNCDWRLPTTIPAGSGASPTNADGVWFAIDAGTLSQTPADFDGFASPALPNSGVAVDQVSTTQSGETGVFKNPPFVDDQLAAGGTPVNQWVDVSVEVTAQTNVSLYMDRSLILGAGSAAGSLSSIQAGGPWTNGTPMLGYLDPTADVSDNTAFVYYSNLRAVELSPAITNRPLSVIAPPGTNVSFTSTATYGTAPITNVWYIGNTGPVVPLQTNMANATNLTDTLIVTNVTAPTNFFVVFSDVAGSVTSLVANLEILQGPTNATANAGTTFTFNTTALGQLTPITYQWQFNGANLTNGTHYSGVATTNLVITNIQAADIGTYSIIASNSPAVMLTNFATLSVTPAAPTAVVSPAVRTVNWGSSASFTVAASGTTPFTYQWQRAGTNISDGGNILGSTTTKLTLSPVTDADIASYTVGVTNSLGGAISSAGLLSVSIPPPTFSRVAIANGNVTLSFSSTNSSDTTNAFILLSSPVVTGPYTNTPATFSSNGTFRVTVPQTGTSMFYRLQHVN